MAYSGLTGERVGFLARATRGLEWVAAGEIKGRPGAAIVAAKHREIRFELSTLDAGVLGISTVDDVFLDCGLIHGIDHPKRTRHGVGHKRQDDDAR